jgi:hypothetical protein
MEQKGPRFANNKKFDKDGAIEVRYVDFCFLLVWNITLSIYANAHCSRSKDLPVIVRTHPRRFKGFSDRFK